METAEERAIDFAKFWYGGGNPEDTEDNEMRIQGLAKEIKRMLKEQDKLTRHAIAEAITVEPDEITPDGAYYNMLSKSRAHNIAMNIHAV
ncbi:MAG: hypothetical protein GY801_00325 [bacterium]|nr:hypothetical protein [bacterium]